MLIQTNLSAVKANQGTPVDVVEEWLKENGRVESLPDNLVKGDSYFNNVNTKEIQKRQIKNKQRACDLHEAIVSVAGNLPKSKAREIDFSDEHYTNLVSQVKSRFFNGELVKATDYKGVYAISTMSCILSRIAADLRSKGFEIVTLKTEAKRNLGWITESALNERLLTKKNAEAVRKHLEPINDLSSQQIYHQTIAEIAQRILAGQFVRVEEYTARHSRVVTLRMVALALKKSNIVNDVVSVNYERGRKAGWVLESEVHKKLTKVNDCPQTEEA